MVRISNRAALLVLLGLGGAAAVAGSLEPPPGPVTPTPKALVEVEPRIAVNALPGDATALHVIDQTGSYYLTEKIVGEPGKGGIRVEFAVGGDAGVTIDLAGFTLEGVPGSLDGIEVFSSARITNGAIVRWGGNGVTLARGIVDNLRVETNGGDGIHVSSAATIHGCTALGNGGHGVSGGDNLTVLDSITSVNGGRGIHLDAIAVVRNCIAYSNDAGGIRVLGNSIIESCTLDSNSGPGIEVAAFCRVAGNRILSSGLGILVGALENHIDGNSVRGTIRVEGSKNVVVRNVIHGTATPLDVAPGNLVGAASSDPLTAGPWDNFVTAP